MPPAPIASSSKKVPIRTPGSGKAVAAGPVCASACNRRAVLLEVRTTVGGSGVEGTAWPSDAGSPFETRLSELSKLLIGSEICIDSSSSERGSSPTGLPGYAICSARNLQRDMSGDKPASATLSHKIVDIAVAAVNGPCCRACLVTLSSGICHLSSAICHLSSAICHLPSATCHLPSAICHLSSAIRYLPSAICHSDRIGEATGSPPWLALLRCSREPIGVVKLLGC